MQSKNHKLAQLAAMLARNLSKESAHTCAGLAIELTSIGASIERVETWACNGYKDERIDEHVNKLSRVDTTAANDYCTKINEDGLAYVTRRMTQLEKKLASIRFGTGLDFQYAGLSGVCWTMPNGSEFFI